MQPFTGNLPDQVWSRLKDWAKKQAAAQISPTHDECVAYVQQAAADITGRSDSLRGDVIIFYAGEVAEMISKFRSNNGSPGTSDLEAAI